MAIPRSSRSSREASRAKAPTEPRHWPQHALRLPRLLCAARRSGPRQTDDRTGRQFCARTRSIRTPSGWSRSSAITIPSRFITDAGGSVPRLKLALGLLATLRGMPQLYSGDEIGMEGGNDPDNRRDFPGGFPGDKHNAFTSAGRTATEQEIFAWTSGMLALRASHQALKTGLEQDLFADDDVFAFVRASERGRLFVQSFIRPLAGAAPHYREQGKPTVNLWNCRWKGRRLPRVPSFRSWRQPREPFRLLRAESCISKSRRSR